MKNINVFNNTDYDINLNIYRYFLSHAVKAANIDGEVNLVFSNDDYIRGLNKQFRNKDKANENNYNDELNKPSLIMALSISSSISLYTYRAFDNACILG